LTFFIKELTLKFNTNSRGLDRLRQQLEEAERAFDSLEGTFVILELDPKNPESAEVAIRQMESQIDSKIAPYRDNSIVSKMAQELKDKYREMILERVNSTQE
jgi:hypothetical protein